MWKPGRQLLGEPRSTKQFNPVQVLIFGAFDMGENNQMNTGKTTDGGTQHPAKSPPELMDRLHDSIGTLEIDGHDLTIQDVYNVAVNYQPVGLSPLARKQLLNSRQVVENILDKRETCYGITTGFGKFKDQNIEPEDSRALQRNLLLSHAAGVGKNLDEPTVRAMMLLRANALAKGFSGIRLEVVELLLELLNSRIHPHVPEQGSLGASGDLCPLAHLSLVLIGEGKANYKGQVLDGSEALSRAGLTAVVLEAKEGLALVNGTQLMSALGCLILAEAYLLIKTADILGTLSLEALMGSGKPFAEAVHRVRPHPGQIASAENIRRLLDGSTIGDSHKDCAEVQDAYSLRCMAQVHGASRQAFNHGQDVFSIEINSATDNPLVFADEIISGGNFHGQPLALVMDYMAIALAEMANISERRTERLVNPNLSNGLPAFLTPKGGINSGLMIAQYTAASLVSENKSLAHPASVDSIPTSANQEDHVSMGPIAGRKARQILENLKRVFAIELICAAQGLDYRLDANLKPSPALYKAHELIRKHLPRLDSDREIHKDIETATKLIESGQLVDTVESLVGKLS